MGPSQSEPLSPLLCMHMPKPITIQACNIVICRQKPFQTDTSLQDMDLVTLPSPTESTTTMVPALKPSQCTYTLTPIGRPRKSRQVYQCCVSPGVCGQLLLEPSGTVDLKDVIGRCTVSIGRPLDEVVHIKVESGSLKCNLNSESLLM